MEFATLIRRIALLTVAYYGTGRFGLFFANYHENATLVWPPTGLALALLILYGVRLWPGVFLGTLLLNTAEAKLTGFASIGVGIGNTLEAVIGASLLMRVVDFRPSFDRVRDVITFVGLGAVLSTTVSASMGVVTLLMTGGIGAADPWTVWMIWWLGDAGGAVILAPAILIGSKGAPRWREVGRNIEFWAVFALIVGLCLWSFSGAVAGPLAFVAIFTPFPLVVWAGTRLGSRGAALSTFLIMSISTVATAQGTAPFVMDDPQTSMMMLWTYGVTMGITGLTLAASTSQRSRAERLFRAGEQQRRHSEREKLLMEERQRITREMHDGLGGQLVSTLSMVQRGLGSHSEVAESLRRALDDMRILIDSLDPSTTDFAISLGKLRARLEPLLRRNDIRLVWNVVDSPWLAQIPQEESLHILRIIQEGVTNAVRHAAANQIEVSVSLPDGARGPLSIEVRDNGHGPMGDAFASGRGIRNMETRAATLGAELSIEECKPGMRIRLRLPVSG